MAFETRIADQLRAWGLTVVEEPGWKTRGVRSRKTGNPYRFAPLGVMAHHTAARSYDKDLPSRHILINGRKGLRGPLCHVGLARSGTCHVIAAGHANHAGRGKGWRKIPASAGNSRWLGIEAENDGRGEEWSDEQYSAYVVCSAALLDMIGQDASMLAGHREWAPGRKIDPHGIGMDTMRSHVAKALTRGPGGSVTTGVGGAASWSEPEVRLAQSLLTALGPAFNPGPIDGDRGPKTRRAERAAAQAGINLRSLMSAVDSVIATNSEPVAVVDTATIRNHATAIQQAANKILETAA